MKEKERKHRSIHEKIVPTSVVDVNDLNRLQKRFSAMSHLFTFAYSANGNQLTELSGKKEQVEWVKKSLGMQRFYAAYQRVQENELEDMIIEDTPYDNMKIGAIAIRLHGKMILCWIVVGNIVDYDTLGGGLGKLEAIDQKTTYGEMLKAMDLLQFFSLEYCENKKQISVFETEKNDVRKAEEKMRKAVERSEATARVVQFLERTDAIEDVLEDLIHFLGKYLGLQSAHVFRLFGNRKMQTICEWYRGDMVPYFEKTETKDRLSFLRGDKVTVISYDTKLSLSDRGAMDICGATGVVSIPITIKKIPDLYVLFVSGSKNIVWNPEDIRFMSDAVKIMQNIMVRKIQKNSLAVSFSSLEAILNHSGAAILVQDHESLDILFINQMTKAWFSKEIQNGRINEIFSLEGECQEIKYEKYEVTHDRWMDITRTKITWVDGRVVTLFTAYDISEKKEYQRKIELQAQTDYLTGLYNRMYCMERLTEYIGQTTQMQHMQGAVIFIDLDDFKTVNDTLGHDKGDVLLKSVSKAIKSVQGLEDNCYRMGGDEFVCIISPKQYAQSKQILEELQRVFEMSWSLKDLEYHCTMSMGVSLFPKDGDDPQDLISKADEAMYRAKKNGKNKMEFYEKEDEYLLVE